MTVTQTLRPTSIVAPRPITQPSVSPQSPSSKPPPSRPTPGVAIALAIVETLAGRRSPAQLRAWVNEKVQLVAAYEHRRGRLRDAAIASVRSQMPARDAVEVTVRLLLGGRSVACALRLDQHPGRWVCTDLQVIA